jgi:Tfp pilus assembly protein PilX
MNTLAGLRARTRDDRGSAMITVILMGVVLTALVAALMASTLAEATRSGQGETEATAMAAAEAGVDNYISKLTEDHTYYNDYVHPAEATRNDGSGKVGTAGQAWTGATTWTYPNGRDTWLALGNGYEYDVQITPPATGSQLVKVVSMGRQTGSTTNTRTIEVLVRAASVADFQMVSNANVSYGSTATTRGKIYAGIDSSNVKHSINHAGTAYGNLYAEGSITGSPTYMNNAKGFNSTTIRSVIPTPINFNTFTSSLVDLKSAAQSAGGIYLDDSTKDAWKLTFNSAGTVTIASCTRTSSYDVAYVAPTCTTTSTVTVPAVGAVYANQTIIVSGMVKGQVTVASNANMVIADAISYVKPGLDVLGLIAKNDMIVAAYVPFNLTWSAATVAQTGQWRSYSSSTDHGTMTFNGSTATDGGGFMSMFATRNYNYDSNLLYLQPPFFPLILDTYTVVSFRELPSS